MMSPGKIQFALLLAASVANLPVATYFIATNGSDINPGTEAAPFYNLSKAIPLAMAGDNSMKV
jgi:hypothetical protein